MSDGLTSPEIVTKYKRAAKIANEALQLVVLECKPTVKIVDLCEMGDAYIREQIGNVSQIMAMDTEKGVSFPTCISVNNTVCNFSPLDGDETVLKEGDMLKIHMGCHIEGFSAFVAHTFVLQEGPVTGGAADVIAAVNNAAEVALKLIRPGKKNKNVTDATKKVVAAYDCKFVEGFFTLQGDMFTVDGNEIGLSVSDPDRRGATGEFKVNEAYVIDIKASTGEGKPKLLDEKQITIYKREAYENYQLKGERDKLVLKEIDQKFPIVPFTVRALEANNAQLGVVKCMKHNLLTPYPVLHVKPDEYVAHIAFTVTPNGLERITSHPLQELQPTKTEKKGGGKKRKAGKRVTSRKRQLKLSP